MGAPTTAADSLYLPPPHGAKTVGSGADTACTQRHRAINYVGGAARRGGQGGRDELDARLGRRKTPPLCSLNTACSMSMQLRSTVNLHEYSSREPAAGSCSYVVPPAVCSASGFSRRRSNCQNRSHCILDFLQYVREYVQYSVL